MPIMGKPHSAVFIAKVRKSFKPAHALTQPDDILGGKFLARRLSLPAAVGMATAYNKTHLPSEGTYRHKWAIAIADLKWCPRAPHVAPAQVKGGADHA